MTSIPWKLIGYAAAAAAAIALAWWLQQRIRVSYQAEEQLHATQADFATYREAVQTSALMAAGKMERDQIDDAAHAIAIAQLQSENERIAAAAAAKPPTMEKTDANGVTHSVVSGDWWLCHSTFVTRDPADISACEASASLAGLPYAVSDRRVQVPPAVQQPRSR